jgi:hypothetical protein
MLSSVYVVILKEPFPEYPKTLKIPQYIEIPLEAQNETLSFIFRKGREN